MELRHKHEAAIERILGATALLELKLVRDAELTTSILEDIDGTLKLLCGRNELIEELERAVANAVAETPTEEKGTVTGSVFERVLGKYFNGEPDAATLRLAGIAPRGR